MERKLYTRSEVSARTFLSCSSDQLSQRNHSSVRFSIADRSPGTGKRFNQNENNPKSPQTRSTKSEFQRLSLSSVSHPKAAGEPVTCSISGRPCRRSRHDVAVAPYYGSSRSPRPGGPNSSMRFRDYKPVAEISLGIENEFLAEARCGAEISEASTEFIYNMAKLHNQFVPSTYPRMESQVRYGEDITSRPPRDFTCWVVETEDELGQDGDSARHGIEIKSPQLKTLHEPGWRKQIEETWAFLGKYYRISKTPACSTHIHVSIRRGGEGGIGMGLHIMKKIAQCIIHFEPAFEALVPPERRGNMWAASNWIDNRLFVGSDFTREKVIEEIDNCNSTEEVVHMMSPPPQGKLWAWNFQAMKKFGTIEFRKGSASLNSRDAIGWAELVLYFVQAAIGMESIKSMLRVPANIGSLKSFLGRQLVENNTIFEGKKDQDSVQPELIYFRHDQREILKKKLFLDEMKQANLCASKGKQKRCPKIKDRASTASPD